MISAMAMQGAMMPSGIAMQPPVGLYSGGRAASCGGAFSAMGMGTPSPVVAGLPQNQTLTGTVKVWRLDKGFGFITPDLGGPDVFVHRNQLEEGTTLEQGKPCTFQCRFHPGRGKYETTTCAGLSSTGGGQQPLEGPMNNLSVAGLPLNTRGQQPLEGPMNNLFVAGLPLNTSEGSITAFFGQYGVVQQIKLLPNQHGKPDRAALVRFAEDSQAKWMVDNLNDFTPPGWGHPLSIRFASTGQSGGPASSQPRSGYGPVSTPGYSPVNGAVANARYSPYQVGGPSRLVGGPVDGQAGLSADVLATALTQLSPPTIPVRPLPVVQPLPLIAPQPAQLTQATAPLVGGGQANIAGLVSGARVALPSDVSMPMQPISSPVLIQPALAVPSLQPAAGTMLMQPTTNSAPTPPASCTALMQPAASTVPLQFSASPWAMQPAAFPEPMQPTSGPIAMQIPVSPGLIQPDAGPVPTLVAVAPAPTQPADCTAPSLPTAALAPTQPVAGLAQMQQTLNMATMQPIAGFVPIQAAACSLQHLPMQPVAVQPLTMQPVAMPSVAMGAVAQQAPLFTPTPTWLTAIDPASGRPYYYHSATREVRWDKPPEIP